MKKIVIHTGFHPEVHREYRGEHIYKVVQTKTLGTDGKVVLDANGSVIPNAGANVFYKLDHTGWIKSVGPEMYVTDWCAEERWGRVEAVEIDGPGGQSKGETLGFMLLRVDRANGAL